MTTWKAIPAVLRLRAEFDVLAPGRNKASDGIVGDLAHQERTSDHNPDETGSVPVRDADKANEVHALDIDTDLREPGLTMEMVVQFLLSRCRAGAETRLRYIIFNRRIWEASTGWRQRAYTGTSDPHTGHAHFSFSYDTAREASTASFRLEDVPVALTATDKAWIAEQINASAKKAAAEVWQTLSVDPYDTNPKPRQLKAIDWLRWSDSRGQGESMRTAVLAELGGLVAKVDALNTKVDQVIGQRPLS